MIKHIVENNPISTGPKGIYQSEMTFYLTEAGSDSPVNLKNCASDFLNKFNMKR